MTIDKARVEEIRRAYCGTTGKFERGYHSGSVSDLLAYIDQQAAPPDATEIETRLRESVGTPPHIARQFMQDAADTIAAQAKRIEALEAALKGLSDMYSHAWDSVDGNLVMLGPSVPKFEKAHAAAYAALASGKEG